MTRQASQLWLIGYIVFLLFCASKANASGHRVRITVNTPRIATVLRVPKLTTFNSAAASCKGLTTFNPACTGL